MSDQVLKRMADGVAHLDALMRTHGFIYRPGAQGQSSGGDFASGEFVRGGRRLELHFRYSLGLVRYHVGDASLSHDDYMRGVLGKGGRYPGFSDDPLDGFRFLRDDLEQHGSAFLSGEDKDFQAIIEQVRRNPRPRLP